MLQTRPHRSRRRPPLSAARRAGRLDAGAARRLRRSGVAAAGPSRHSLDRRCRAVRHLAASATEAADDIGRNDIWRDCQFHRQSLRRHRARRGDGRALSARSEKPADTAPAVPARHRRHVVLHARCRVVDRQRLARSAVADSGRNGAARRARRHRRHVAASCAAGDEDRGGTAGAVLLGLGGAFGLESFATLYSIALSLFQLAGFATCACCWHRGTAARCWPRKIAASAGLRSARCMVIPFVVTDFRALAPGYSGSARRTRRAAGRHRRPDRGRQHRDPASRHSDDDVAFARAPRCSARRRLRLARCRCRAGHAVLCHRDLGRAHHRPDDGHAARLVRVPGAGRAEFRCGIPASTRDQLIAELARHPMFESARRYRESELAA